MYTDFYMEEGSWEAYDLGELMVRLGVIDLISLMALSLLFV
jgi:hypothetical protein